MKAKIIGTGAFCPEAVSDDKFIEIYGKKAIAASKLLQHHSRYLATDVITGEAKYSNVEMGYYAAIKAIEEARIENNDIDMIIYSTVTPDYIVPPCFALLQEKLHVSECMGFDIRSGCAGFGSAMTIAETYITSGRAKKVLIVGVDLLSTRFTELKKMKKEMPLKAIFNYMFFGDGAGAVILGETADDETAGILYSEMNSDSAHLKEGSMIEIGGSVFPYPCESVKEEQWPIFQASGLSDKYLPEVLVKAIVKAQEKSLIDMKEIDTFVMPVASKKIMENVQKELPMISEKKIFSCGNEGGAMINAAVPVSLNKAISEEKIKKGTKILIYAAENTKWQHAVIITEW